MLEPSIAAVALANDLGVESLRIDDNVSIMILDTVEGAVDKSGVVLGNPRDLADDKLLRLKGVNGDGLVLALRNIKDVELHVRDGEGANACLVEAQKGEELGVGGPPQRGASAEDLLLVDPVGDTVEHIRTSVGGDLVDLSFAVADEEVVVAHKSHGISSGCKLRKLDITNLVLDKRLTLARLNVEDEFISGDKLGRLLRDDVLENEITLRAENNVVSISAGRRPLHAESRRPQFGARACLIEGENTIALADRLMGLARRIDG
ncbi:hypothetical protein HG530_011864 [Fusarium avenaceum]|nr:hypothetical protein HG530_011864 [Fusarium avenaceum]